MLTFSARGYADGSATETMFDFPSDVMFDEREQTKLIVLDDYNDAIRSVDIATKVNRNILSLLLRSPQTKALWKHISKYARLQSIKL